MTESYEVQKYRVKEKSALAKQEKGKRGDKESGDRSTMYLYQTGTQKQVPNTL